jgi:xylan 1,4-beta-xylosidase
VASDHFEELGRPDRLLHGGFGLLTVGNLAKPKFWALALAERLGEQELPATVDGDGAGSLVEAWAARSATGTVGLLVWNGTLDHAKAAGDPTLDRRLTVRVSGLSRWDCRCWTVRHWRIDEHHSNIGAVWRAVGGGQHWPDEAGWRALHAADAIAELGPPAGVAAPDGTVEITFDLPNPAISYLEFSPDSSEHVLTPRA